MDTINSVSADIGEESSGETLMGEKEMKEKEIGEIEVNDIEQSELDADVTASVETNPVDVLIEVSTSGRTPSRFTRIAHFPFTVGRAYDNDLILSDDTVSAHHLVVHRQDGEIIVENISNENGTRYQGKTLDAARTPVTLTAELVAGRSHLRILSADTAIAPTRTIEKLSRFSRICSDLRTALFLLFCYFLMNIYYAYETQSLWLDFNEVIVGQLLELVLPLAAATVMGFISHLLLHRWRWPLQLSIASIFFLFQMFIDEFAGFTSYFFTSDGAAGGLQTIVSVVVFIVLLGWQLRVLSHLGIKRSNWISAGVICPLFLVFVLQDVVGQPDFISQPQMHTVLRSSDIRTEPTFDSIPEFRLQIENEIRLGIQKELEEE